MTPQTASRIRQDFLDFFKSKEHEIVPSAPIVVKNDPTLLFTNAGMNQFKDYFLGNKEAAHKRVVDTQKCLRVSGKHNDLEEVGVDTYHHTMFEMLGNWSFGDYFKAEAIAWAWELLTEVYGLDKDRLYVTIFEGDKESNLPRDEEAYEEWKKWLPEERILNGNKKDNFWEMGNTGPCGPCSEIHIDCRPDAERAAVPGASLVNAGHPQVMEIWNLVFMQFNRKKDGSLTPLPAMHVDTGMGLERLVRVIQGKDSNYDTDIFTGTISRIAQLTGRHYSGDGKEAIAFRVIADHIRAIAFAIADGQMPSNTGAGYVIRRILRRAVRYYYSYLDYKEPLLYQLIPGLAQQFAGVFPELQEQAAFVGKAICQEEENFLRTLAAGLKKMESLTADAGQQGSVIGGAAAFELYDTYGFPLDLTRLMAAEQGLSVDEAGFEEAMRQQKERARKATAVDAGDWVVLKVEGAPVFVGYNKLQVTTQVLRYRRVEAKKQTRYQIVLEETPFYAEMGGQVGDTGTLSFGGATIPVVDTQQENGLIIHLTEKLPSSAGLSGMVEARVDEPRRMEIIRNHSATHLLHAALRQVLGTHVQQKGSLVSPELLRFDISHPAKVSEEELRQVIDIVNEKIRANIPVEIKEMPKEEAMKLGAMALFGEKYGDRVRVVTIDPDFSVELCGGTHVTRTGKIGVFIITAESAVAAGIRRIEALTGTAAVQYLSRMQAEHKQITGLLKSKEPVQSIERLMSDKAALEKKMEVLADKERSRQAKALMAGAEKMGDITFIAAQIACDSAKDLKKIAFDLQALGEKVVAVVSADIGGKACVALLVSDALVKEKGWDAGKIIRETVSPLIKGGGGGQPSLATPGGTDVAGLPAVSKAVRQVVAAG